jgi:23S rRNA pseudouridine1911/1915/1917 synthase
MTEFSAERDGERLDVFLARMDGTLSRSRIQKLIADGRVTVDGKIPKASQRLAVGATVAVELPEMEATDVVPEDIPLDILYEDEDVIVVNKARGMVVHPAAGVSHGTLVNALLAHCKDLSGINGALRPGIVHRLDKDTSGVMIAAKNDAAHRSLAEQIQEKTAKRVYWAILTGNIAEAEGVIHGAIGRNPKDRQKMAVVRENGKDATTKFRVLERFGAYTLVECRLMTGRTHQIRVHMAYIGHPVLGDPKYGAKKCPFSIEGQALHSKTLMFTHPRTGERMEFEAPLPEDMQMILDELRGKK